MTLREPQATQLSSVFLKVVAGNQLDGPMLFDQ